MTISRREFAVQSGCALTAIAAPMIVPASVAVEVLDRAVPVIRPITAFEPSED